MEALYLKLDQTIMDDEAAGTLPEAGAGPGGLTWTDDQILQSLTLFQSIRRVLHHPVMWDRARVLEQLYHENLNI